MRYEVQVTYTSKTNFAVEAETAAEAHGKAMEESLKRDPQYINYDVEVIQGVK